MFDFAKDLVSDVADFGKELVGSEDVPEDQIYDVEAGKKKSEIESVEEDEDGEVQYIYIYIYDINSLRCLGATIESKCT